MDYAQWAGRYIAVTTDLGYSRDEDARAARVLAETVAKVGVEMAGDAQLSKLLEGKVVYVCGAGPTLEAELGDTPLEGTVIAADSAAARLMARGTVPDLIVTDLDGDLDAIVRASERGALVVVHAHGDNIALIEGFIPRLKGALIPSVQCEPPPGTRNFGGLTDGDRAVFLADHFAASQILLAGFDFGDEVQHPLPPEKQRKFIWGAILIASLDNPHVRFLDERPGEGVEKDAPASPP